MSTKDQHAPPEVGPPEDVAAPAQAEPPQNGHVIMVGNPVDGVRLYGPFPSVEGAVHVGDTTFPNDTWWVVEVERMPEEGA